MRELSVTTAGMALLATHVVTSLPRLSSAMTTEPSGSPAP